MQQTPPDKKNRIKIKKYIRREITTIWQERWTNSTKGRITHRFFDDVQERIAKEKLETDHYTVQFLSGHGNIRSKLKELGLSGNEHCSCGSRDTVYRIIYDCKNLDHICATLIADIEGQKIIWPCALKHLTREKTFKYFRVFAREVLKRRENQQTHSDN